MGKPAVPELLATSEAVVLTSIQEGFGLPYLEAASAGRPLIARTLPNVAPDLAQFGFLLPQSYDELVVDPSLFDWESERQRQAQIFRVWSHRIPHGCRPWIGTPALLAAGDVPRATPFSRLTLTAQLQVLTAPLERSWELCSPLNSFLIEWRKAAANGQLQATPWPVASEQWLSGAAYARRFERLLQTEPLPGLEPAAGSATQEDFLRERLDASNLFPLLWTSTP
jgi:hypothetical protein